MPVDNFYCILLTFFNTTVDFANNFRILEGLSKLINNAILFRRHYRLSVIHVFLFYFSSGLLLDFHGILNHQIVVSFYHEIIEVVLVHLKILLLQTIYLFNNFLLNF